MNPHFGIFDNDEARYHRGAFMPLIANGESECRDSSERDRQLWACVLLRAINDCWGADKFVSKKMRSDAIDWVYSYDAILLCEMLDLKWKRLVSLVENKNSNQLKGE